MLQFSSSWNIGDFCPMMASPKREMMCFFGDTKRVRRSLIQDKVKVSTGNHFLKALVFYSTKKKSQLDDFQLLSVGCLNISKTQTWVQLPSNSKISEALITSKNLVFQSWISEGDELPYLLISQLPLSKEYLRKPMKYPKSQTGRESILTCLAPPYPNTRAIRGLAGCLSQTRDF